jgi:hypothetical protein
MPLRQVQAGAPPRHCLRALRCRGNRVSGASSSHGLYQAGCSSGPCVVSEGIPSYIAILLDMPLRDVEQIVYFNAYVVLEPGNADNLSYKQLLTEDQWIEIEDQLYDEETELSGVEVGIGAEALSVSSRIWNWSPWRRSCGKTLPILRARSGPS